jgi:Tetratricopeptide repeat
MTHKQLLPTSFFVLIAFALYAQTPPTPAPDPALRAADSLFQASDYKTARNAYVNYLKNNPPTPNTLARLGFACIQLKQPAEALQYLNKASALNPSAQLRAAIAARSAMAYALQKNNKTALDSLDNARRAGYNNTWEMDNLPAFAGLRADPRFKEIRQRAHESAFPCSTDPNARLFDFWIGEWDVYVRGGNQRAGSSVIESISGDCAILENWTTWRGPFNGKSINFYEAATGKWKQVWVGAGGGASVFEQGEYRDGAMRFISKSTDAQGRETLGNFIFYNLGPNKVRQYYETSTDGGKTYQVSYDFIYVRKGTD